MGGESNNSHQISNHRSYPRSLNQSYSQAQSLIIEVLIQNEVDLLKESTSVDDLRGWRFTLRSTVISNANLLSLHLTIHSSRAWCYGMEHLHRCESFDSGKVGDLVLDHEGQE